MAIYVGDSSREYERPEEGLHRAVCCDVVDLGIQQTAFGPKRQVELRWALEDEDSTGKRFVVRQRYTASLNEKAKLCQHLELWRGRKFTAAERKNFDLEVLIGVNCQLQVIHHISDDGRTFANVQAVIGAAKGILPLVVPATYVRQRDRERAVEADPFEAQGSKAEVDDADDIPF